MDQKQNQDGLSSILFSNTDIKRKEVYILVKELSQRDDFRYLIQAKNRREESVLSIGAWRIKNISENLSSLIEDCYKKGGRYLQIETNNTRLNVHLGRFRIKVQTGDESIAKNLRSTSGIILYNGPDGNIDNRKSYEKFCYSSLGFLRGMYNMLCRRYTAR